MPELYRQLVDANGDYLLSSTGDNLYVKASQVSTFTINLYQLSGEKTRVNKTEFITSVGTLTGTLRNGTSIVNPSITIEMANVPTFNYVYISVFGRYYFVDNITSVVNNLWQIDLSCDVLYTYKTQIGNLNAFVLRNENESTQELLPNIAYPTTYYRGYSIRKGVTHQYYPTWRGSSSYFVDNDRRYVMKINGVAHYREEYQAYQELKSIEPTIPILMDCKHVNYLRKAFYAQNLESFNNKSLIDYVTDFYALPLEPMTRIKKDDGTLQEDWVTDIVYGKYKYFPIYQYQESDLPEQQTRYQYKQIGNVSGSGNNDIFNNGLARTTEWKITIGRDELYGGNNKYKNFSPYTTYKLQFQPFGVYELDFNQFIEETGTGDRIIYIRCTINPLTGDAVLYWGHSPEINENATPYYLGKSNVKISIPFNGQNINNMGALTSAVTGAVAGAKLLASGGVESAVVGAVGGGIIGGAMGKVIANNNSSITSREGAYTFIDDAPQLIIERSKQIGGSANLYGLPLYQYLQLSTLTGFTQVDRVHVENVPNATQPEIDEIESLLKSGVIL